MDKLEATEEVAMPDEGERVLCMFYGGQINKEHFNNSLEKELCMTRREQLHQIETLEPTLVIQKLLLAPKKEDESQRNKIF